MDAALRLNLDASWVLRAGPTRLVFDPWLVGDGVAGGRWFSVQTLQGPVVSPCDVGEVDAVVLSQGFADHAHAETLSRLPGVPRLLTVPEASGVARRALPAAHVSVLPRWGEAPAVVGALRLWRFSAPWWRPPRYHAVLVVDDAGRAVLHAPHGVPWAEVGAAVAGLEVALVATSRKRLDLPFWLGGAPQPGPEAAATLVDATRPRCRMVIHDGPKLGRGLVARWLREGTCVPDDAWIDAAVGAEVPLRAP